MHWKAQSFYMEFPLFPSISPSVITALASDKSHRNLTRIKCLYTLVSEKYSMWVKYYIFGTCVFAVALCQLLEGSYFSEKLTINVLLNHKVKGWFGFTFYTMPKFTCSVWKTFVQCLRICESTDKVFSYGSFT